MSETNKKRLQLAGIGAGVGAVLLRVFWLLGDVAHVLGLSFQDSSFFLGLVLTLVGLLMVVRGPRGAKYTVAMGHPQSNQVQAAINPSLADQEEPKPAKGKEPGQVQPAPCICLGAGLLNVVVCAITFLF